MTPSPKPLIIALTAALALSFLPPPSNAQSSCSLAIGSPYRAPSVSTVYVITETCQKRPIFNPDVYFSYFDSWSSVVFVESYQLDAVPDHPLRFLPWGPRRTFRNGSLVKITSDPKVYLLMDGKAYPIEDEASFTSLGYSFNQIEDVTEDVLNSFTKQTSSIRSVSDLPASFVFKYANDPAVYVLRSVNGELVKLHVTTMEQVRNIVRADRLAVLPSNWMFGDGIDSNDDSQDDSQAQSQTDNSTQDQSSGDTSNDTGSQDNASSTSTADTTNPAVSFTSPASGATVSGIVTVQASASDNVGVASVRFSIGSTTIATDTSSPYTASLNTALYSNGSYTLTALATDTSGNTASVTRSVTIANTSGNGSTVSIQTVDPNATDETKALFSNLQAITANEGPQTGIMFGMENALSEGYFKLGADGNPDWSIPNDGNSDIREITGHNPAVVGFDASSVTGDWWNPADPNFESYKTDGKINFRDQMRINYANGGINEMAWHMDNPQVENGGYRDGPHELWRIASPEACVALVQQYPELSGQCGTHFSDYASRIDELADWMKTVTDDQGRPIPIVFRPFHENSGGWFWWGADGQPIDRYHDVLRAVWAWTVNEMTNVKGAHQLLFAISPNGNGGGAPWSREQYLAFSPGLDLVDVLGYDFYSADGIIGDDPPSWGSGAMMELPMIVQLARENGKIAAYTEGGYTGNYLSLIGNASACAAPNGALYQFWSEKTIRPVLSVGGVAWYYTWFSRPWGEVYGPVPDHCTGDDFLALYQNHEVLLAGETAGGATFDYYTLH